MSHLTVLTLTGTPTGQWAPTPGGTAEADHYTLLSEAYPPGDETSYVQCNGHVAGLIEEIAVSSGPAGISIVDEIHLLMYASGDAITASPAFRAEVVVGGVVVGSREFGYETGGTFMEGSISIPVSVLGSTWTSGPRVIRFVPIDGGAGYGSVPHEEE